MQNTYLKAIFELGTVQENVVLNKHKPWVELCRIDKINFKTANKNIISHIFEE